MSVKNFLSNYCYLKTPTKFTLCILIQNQNVLKVSMAAARYPLGPCLYFDVCPALFRNSSHFVKSQRGENMWQLLCLCTHIWFLFALFEAVSRNCGWVSLGLEFLLPIFWKNNEKKVLYFIGQYGRYCITFCIIISCTLLYSYIYAIYIQHI